VFYEARAAWWLREEMEEQIMREQIAVMEQELRAQIKRASHRWHLFSVALAAAAFVLALVRPWLGF
jgi:hypothetical protein